MRWLVAAVLCLAQPAAAQTLDLGARITASAMAAEALQGPLDGPWRLTDKAGRTLYFIEIVDPVGGRGLAAVWRDSKGASGVVARIRRARARLMLAFNCTRVSLGQTKAGWRGVLSKAGQNRRVSLLRPPA